MQSKFVPWYFGVASAVFGLLYFAYEFLVVRICGLSGSSRAAVAEKKHQVDDYDDEAPAAAAAVAAVEQEMTEVKKPFMENIKA